MHSEFRNLQFTISNFKNMDSMKKYHSKPTLFCDLHYRRPISTCIPRQVALWRPMRSGKKVRAQRSHATSCCTCASQISSSAATSAAAGWSSAQTVHALLFPTTYQVYCLLQIEICKVVHHTYFVHLSTPILEDVGDICVACIDSNRQRSFTKN